MSVGRLTVEDTRITIPFDGDIDITSVYSRSILLLPLGGVPGGGVGSTQTIWDPRHGP